MTNRCDYILKSGKRKGEICGKRFWIEGTKCCVHSPKYMERQAAYSRDYHQRSKLKNLDEPDSKQATPQEEQEIPMQEQPAINHLTNLRELMKITKRNNDLLLLLTMAIAGMNKNKRESNV